MLATEKWDLKLIDSLPRVMWGGGNRNVHCRQTLSSGGLAWLPPLWPYQVTTANPPSASWVTLAEVSDFVLSFPWVWNWKRVPRLPSTPAISPGCLSLWL